MLAVLPSARSTKPRHGEAGADQGQEHSLNWTTVDCLLPCSSVIALS